MSAQKFTSKKRKRDSNPELGFEISQSKAGKIGPLLVSFPALQVPSSTAFQCYSHKRPKTGEDSAKGPLNDGLFVVGETASVEFVSNDDESKKVADSGCRYLLALRNKRTGTVSLLPTAKSPYVMTRTVKALKSTPSSAALPKVQYLQAKTTLGQTFGTKRQKADIRMQERNQVDPDAMQGVMDYVIETIDKGVENLPTAEESQEATDKSRLIPPFSATASNPEDVYPLHNIIPEAEWKVLNIAGFDRGRMALLPHQRSDWLNEHMESLTQVPESKERKKKLKILVYISAMLAFRQAARKKPIIKESLYEKLSMVPTIIVDSLLFRFAEMPRGSFIHQVTSATKTNLLTHLLALCLKLDDFATDPKVIAHDLSIPVTDVHKLFRSLGCKIAKLSERERARLGIPDNVADEKRAILSVPLEFPKVNTVSRK